MGESRNAGRDSWRLLLAELNRQRRSLGRLALWSIPEALPALLSGYLISRALDDGFLNHRPATGLGYLACLGVAYAIAALAVSRSYLAMAGVVEPLRDTLVRKVVSGTLRRAALGRRQPDQAVVARLTQQVEMVRDATAGLLLVLRRVVVTVTAAVIGLLTLTPVLLVYAGPPLLLSLAVFCAVLAVLVRRQRSVVLAEEQVAATATPLFAGLRDVVALGAEQPASQPTGEAIDRHFDAVLAFARSTAMRIVVVTLGVHVPLVVTLFAAPRLVGNGLSAGEIIGAVTYLTMSLEPALRAMVSGVTGSSLRLTVALGRIVETCTVPESAAVHGEARPEGWRVELDQVTFTYGRRAEPVLDDLSLTVAEGEHLAIAGPSGAGKSTLANLIAGVEQAQAGQIRIGGVPHADLDDARLRDTVMLIPQEAYAFTASLEENLTYLRADVPHQELDHVVDLLGLRPLVARLGGYRAEIRPAALSAGERQLIALVRAYLSPASVMVLDEATCHLDPVLEARVEEAFAARHGTLILVAHRMSSILRAERILLLDGRKAVAGTHHSLLAESALYAELAGVWHHEPTFQ